MSAVASPPGALDQPAVEPKPLAGDPAFKHVDYVLSILGSQKIAVAAFAYGIFVILVGTLAQAEKDVLHVVPEYFRAWIMWVDINLFFPPAFFPDWKRLNVPLVPMPGGLVVGFTMIFGITFAHTRWLLQLKTKFTPLVWGMGMIALGWLVTLLIILNGHKHGGFQAAPPFSWETFWTGFQLTVLASWVAAVFAFFWVVVSPFFAALKQQQVTGFRVGITIIWLVLLAKYSLFTWFILMRMAFPGGESLRILWQLTQGTVAGAILLAGSALVFQKRGGVVLLHQGLLLLMLNELFVAHHAVEYNIQLIEGETANYLRDTRTTELALIDRSKSDVDEHIVVPGALLIANASKSTDSTPPKPIADSKNDLPVNITVLQYLRNHDVVKLAKEETSPATKGIGLKEKIVELPVAKGTDTDAPVDQAAAYVKFTDKHTGADLGTFLLSQLGSERTRVSDLDQVKVGDKQYAVALRFQRTYVPFTVKLLDTQRVDYVGTSMPRYFSSDIELKDPTSGVDSKVHIKMNDPLRYSGLTFYQHQHLPLGNGLEMSTLSVVKNRGWLIPYVALMIIAVGMVAHFLLTLTRFLKRREAEEIGRQVSAQPDFATNPYAPPSLSAMKERKRAKASVQPTLAKSQSFDTSWKGHALAVVCSVLIMALFAGKALSPSKTQPNQLDLEAFGKLPVAYGGRVMPIDSLARNTLLQLRQRETAKSKQGETIPATQWLLDLITRSPNSSSNLVLKIDNPDILKVFELEPRSDRLFSTEDLLPHLRDFEDQVAVGRQRARDKKELTVLQRRLLVLDGQLTQYMVLARAFGFADLPPFPEPGDSADEMREKAVALRMAMMESSAALDRGNPPLLIPLADTGKPDARRWMSFHDASTAWRIETELQGEKGDAVVGGFISILRAYDKHARAREALLEAKADPKQAAHIPTLEKSLEATIAPFKTAVERYASLVIRMDPHQYSESKSALEVWLNRVSPFWIGMQLYILAFILAAIGWLIPSKSFNWASFTLVVLTFVLHTAALAIRIYISGRPPVTNLYSSAVFIGWACVFLGMMIELVYRIGLGNLVATATGFATLIIAYFLGMDGDTIGVMQAVLDTQFWLATHVVCITLGYTATFVAGFLGLTYVVLGMATPHLNVGMRKNLGRMIYGITCFAMFFSFFGTVLGGLWGDDSWGRFWGWDPKENGALIIVLWNALLLHARWDKLVGDRGLALLAIGGNIVTAWSWFGVNALGIGLHSYGFKEGVTQALGLFVLSQLILILAGMAPMNLWWSVRKELPPRVA